ncbi:MAG TPA: hypothetical protein V6D17_01685 [Candidatus Obscuribacterales bacterium]
MSPSISLPEILAVLNEQPLLVLSVILSIVVWTPAAYCQGGYDTTEMYHKDTRGQQSEEQNQAEDAATEQAFQNNPDPNYRQPDKVSDVQKWFDQFDSIRYKYEANPEERRFADYLLSKPPGSGMTDEERKFLHNLTERYYEALDKMQEIGGCPEAEKLQTAYMQFLTEQASLYEDYGRILCEPNPVNQMTGRPLTLGLAGRKQNLQTLERVNRRLDMFTRLTFNISRNPYLARPPQQQ